MDSLDKVLEKKGIKRRDFLKLMSATVAALGLSEAYVPKMVEAVEKGVKKPAIIWIKGQDCTGCTTSAISSLDPGPAEVILDLLSFRYHETIMAASGKPAMEAFEATVKEGGHFVVLEGSIPVTDDRYCKSGGKLIKDKVKHAAETATAVIGLGACGAFGGIPAAGPTGAVGVDAIVKDKPVINLPGCPVNPRWLFGTVMHYLMFNELPELDEYKRPKIYFGNLLHDNCPRRGRFERGEFLTDWNLDEQKDWCLLLVGCKGPKTYTDCAQGLWNDGVNFCLNAGSPCSGCTQPEFYAAGEKDSRVGFSPLHKRQDSFALPGIGGIDAEKAGKAMAGVTAAGIGAHVVANLIKGKKNNEEGGDK